MLIKLRSVFKVLLITVIVFSVVQCGDKKSAFETVDFTVKKGTNIAHWLSQSDKRGAERRSFFTEEDVKKIAKMGFDHIRLPIDEEQMWDENGVRHDEAFALLESAIDWAQANKLRVVVDLHILRSHYFNAKVKPLFTEVKEQEKFFDLWRDLSKSLRKYPNGLVAYELMNEAVADENATWNDLLNKAIDAIRELEPKRTIVVGSNRWQSTKTFDELVVPENDKNILLSFHFYEPFLLSHYAAQWTPIKLMTGNIRYPGVILTQEAFEVLPEELKPEVEEYVNVEFNKSVLLDLWKKPIQKAQELGLPLYCGEFGIIDRAPQKASLNWYRDMIALFEDTGIGYANWNYKSDNFGLFNNAGKEYKELTEIVINK